MARSNRKESSLPLCIVLLLSAAYAGVFYYQSYFRLANFQYFDFDLAIGNQICRNLLHGSIDCSIRGGPFLGDHFRPIFFLIVPFYAVFRSPLLLLFLQALTMGFTAVPVYLIGKKLISGSWGALFAFLYLIYPATGYVNSFEFHPVALATFFLAMAAWGWVRDRLWIYYLFSALGVLCREEIALVLCFFGLYSLLMRRRWTWWLISMFAGGIWFVLCVNVFIPYFKKGPFEYTLLLSRFGDNLGLAFINMLRNPAGVVRFLLMSPKPITVLQLLAPVLFLPILSPLGLLPALPIVMSNFLSSYAMAWTIYCQYTAAVIPFIFLSLILAVSRLLARFPGRAFGLSLGVALVAASVCSNFIVGPPASAVKNIFRGEAVAGDVPVLRAVVDSLDGEDGIVATFRFLPLLSSRRSLYPFHYVMWGTGKLTSEPFILPGEAVWAVIDFDDPLTFHNFYLPGMSSNVREFVDGGEWGVVDLIGSVAVLRKGEKSRYRLIGPVMQRAPEDRVNACSADLVYLGYDLEKDEWMGSPAVSLRCYWEAVKVPETDYAVLVQAVDERGYVLETLSTDLGYYILPARSWRRGQRLRTFYRLPLLTASRDGPLFMRVGLFDRKDGRMTVFTLPDGSATVWLPAGGIPPLRS